MSLNQREISKSIRSPTEVCLTSKTLHLERELYKPKILLMQFTKYVNKPLSLSLLKLRTFTFKTFIRKARALSWFRGLNVYIKDLFFSFSLSLSSISLFIRLLCTRSIQWKTQSFFFFSIKSPHSRVGSLTIRNSSLAYTSFISPSGTKKFFFSFPMIF